jgi:hypothetical protein
MMLLQHCPLKHYMKRSAKSLFESVFDLLFFSSAEFKNILQHAIAADVPASGDVPGGHVPKAGAAALACWAMMHLQLGTCNNNRKQDFCAALNA